GDSLRDREAYLREPLRRCAARRALARDREAELARLLVDQQQRAAFGFEQLAGPAGRVREDLVEVRERCETSVQLAEDLEARRDRGRGSSVGGSAVGIKHDGGAQCPAAAVGPGRKRKI